MHTPEYGEMARWTVSPRAVGLRTLLGGLAVAVAACGVPGPPPAGHAGSATAPSRGPVAGDVIARVPTGRTPDGVVAAYGSLWVADYGSGTVTRVDPLRRRVVATIRVGAGPIAVVEAAGAVWVADYDGGSVARIDPRTDRVNATAAVGGKVVAVAGGGGAVWAFDQSGGRAVPLDPATARPGTAVQLGVRSGFVTAAGGLLWVPDFLGGSDTLLAFDPRARRVVRRVRVGAAPIQASFAGGTGWVSNTGDASLTRFSLRTGQVEASVPVTGGSLGPLLAEPRAVWVSVYGGGRIARIDPQTNRVVARMRVGPQPQALARAGPGLWVVESATGDVALLRQP